MSFVVSIRQNFFGGTSAGIYVAMPNANVGTTATNITINMPTPTQYFNFGMLRVKSVPGATGTLRVGGIWALDGNASNTTSVSAGDYATSNVPVDHNYGPLITDLKANQVIVSLTASVAGQVDIEFAGV